MQSDWKEGVIAKGRIIFQSDALVCDPLVICVCVCVACISTLVSRSGLDYGSQCVVHRFPGGPQDSVCKVIIS